MKLSHCWCVGAPEVLLSDTKMNGKGTLIWAAKHLHGQGMVEG